MSTIATAHDHVVCPPWPDAACKKCGDVLSLHQSSDPDDQPTPSDAACIGDLGQAFFERRLPDQFELADDETLDCPDVTTCDLCETRVCCEHSSQFVTCVDSSSTLHHIDCQANCIPCMASIARDN